MLPRNDPRQYDGLADQWWNPDGAFAMLHWLAASRGKLIPPPARDDAVLVDIGCGGGLNAPHVRGYRHIGVDLRRTSLSLAAGHGVHPLAGDAMAVPLADGCADVVVAGEILEHVPHWPLAVAEACRLLRPGGTLVVDTLADTLLCRFVVVTLGERIPGGPPRGIHDPALFVPPQALLSECARHGVTLQVWGLRPATAGLLRWLLGRKAPSRPGDAAVSMRRTRSTSILYAGKGVKSA
jgi:2-polyprenyl-6-hydroxyphenyl methylase/3-demethylubiquinone-9 3-methyltransferase